MYKLGHEVAGEVVEHVRPAIFMRTATSDGGERLVAGVPHGDARILEHLAARLAGPFFVLYVLHTSRGEGEIGRYQSTLVERTELTTFLRRYAAFIAGDGRFDLWVYSPDEAATLVVDRHNLLHAYGPLDGFTRDLLANGFQEGDLPRLDGHMHYYREAFDQDAESILTAFNWIHTPLRPQDEQIPSVAGEAGAP
jgi:hypothetical protein